MGAFLMTTVLAAFMLTGMTTLSTRRVVIPQASSNALTTSARSLAAMAVSSGTGSSWGSVPSSMISSMTRLGNTQTNSSNVQGNVAMPGTVVTDTSCQMYSYQCSPNRTVSFVKSNGYYSVWPTATFNISSNGQTWVRS